MQSHVGLKVLESFHARYRYKIDFLCFFTWTYAEASNNPNNTAHTDVAQVGQLRLWLVKHKSWVADGHTQFFLLLLIYMMTSDGKISKPI